MLTVEHFDNSEHLPVSPSLASILFLLCDQDAKGHILAQKLSKEIESFALTCIVVLVANY